MKQHTMQNRQMYSLNICNFFFESRNYLLNARMRVMLSTRTTMVLSVLFSYLPFLCKNACGDYLTCGDASVAEWIARIHQTRHIRIAQF